MICSALSLMVALPENAEIPAPEQPGSLRLENPVEVELRGKVVCLAEEMQRLYQAELPANHEHFYGFKTKEGVFYTLLRTKFSEALFADGRVREKELILKGRVFPKTHVLEVMGGLRSVQNGIVNELYYYCDICAIQTIAPGRCMCCQGPVELVEKPLKGADGKKSGNF